MLCFRDMIFCSDSFSECAKSNCDRYWDTAQQKAADKWWGGEGAPIAFSSFKDNCKDFIEEKP